MLNYQNFLYFTERKRNVKNEIVEKIEKLQKLKKKLENKINEHPVKLEAKQKRLTKKQEKEAKERAEREKIYENIEFESVKLEHAFRDFSTTWLVRRKVNERKSRFQHEIVLIDDENTFVKIDIIVLLNKMNQVRKQLYEDHIRIHKNIRINERLRCIFRKWNDSDNKFDLHTADLPMDDYKKGVTLQYIILIKLMIFLKNMIISFRCN